MTPLILLRPEPGASRTAARARALGLDVRLAPLFAVVPVEWTAPDTAEFDALVLTSANAIRHGGEQLRRLLALPVHAVGNATAALARSAGFEVRSTGDKGSREMALPEGQRLLHLAGRDHVVIAGATTIPVYEARATDPPPALHAIDRCVVAVHSPRAGGRLAELVGNRAGTAIAAISTAAADACGPGWQCVQVAPRPSDEALLALAATLCERLAA